MRPTVKIKTSCIPNPATVPIVKHLSKSSTDIKSPPKKCKSNKATYNNPYSQHNGRIIIILVLDKIVKIRKCSFTSCNRNSIVLLHDIHLYSEEVSHFAPIHLPADSKSAPSASADRMKSRSQDKAQLLPSRVKCRSLAK